MPATLTQHGLKQMCEAKKLAEDMEGTMIAVQVVDVTIFGPDKAKKNIKGRVTLSDGVSKVICMLPEKTYDQMVSKKNLLVGKVKIMRISGRLPKTRMSANSTFGSSMRASNNARSSARSRKCVQFYLFFSVILL